MGLEGRLRHLRHSAPLASGEWRKFASRLGCGPESRRKAGAARRSSGGENRLRGPVGTGDRCRHKPTPGGGGLWRTPAGGPSAAPFAPLCATVENQVAQLGCADMVEMISAILVSSNAIPLRIFRCFSLSYSHGVSTPLSVHPFRIALACAAERLLAFISTLPAQRELPPVRRRLNCSPSPGPVRSVLKTCWSD